MTSRREFLALAAACTATTALAQGPKRLVWCGIPSAAPDVDAIARKHWAEMFAPHGFKSGQNLEIEVIRPGWDHQRPDAEWDAIARRLVDSRPDVILVNSAWVAVFQPLTRDIPIVFVGMVDPEMHRTIVTPSRPGGNFTGTLVPYFELQDKKLELLKELRPSAKRCAAVYHAGAYDRRIRERIVETAERLGMEGVPLAVNDSLLPGRVSMAVREARAELVDLLLADRQMHPATLGELSEARIAASAPYFVTVQAGALLAYEPVGVEEIAVDLAARILRGQKVANLPAQQPRQFRLAVNLRTARALGIAIPPSVQLRAHEVYE